MGHGVGRDPVPEQGVPAIVTTSIGVRVVGGYLGAGKTTFINAVLEVAREPIAVVVNDFGSVNIDAVLIAERHDDIIELTNGCICCTVGDSLADTLYSILERPRRPSGILIEASGVADPGAIAAYGHLQGLHAAGTIVLIDAANAAQTHSHPLLARTFERQVVAADIVCLTKTDIASPTRMEQVRALLRTLAPDTPVAIAEPGVFAHIMERPSHSAAGVDPAKGPHGAHHGAHRSELVPADSCPTETQWRTLLGSLPATCMRAKGIVLLADGSRRLVQRVGRHVHLSPTDAAPTGVVVIHVVDER